MEVLYISTLSSKRLVDNLFQETKINPGFAIQKFNRLIATGLIDNGIQIRTCSGIPVSSKRSKKKIWWEKNEVEDGIQYHYPFFVNTKWLRKLCLIINTFFYVLLWGVGNKKEKVIICDVLNQSICIGALLASKLNGIKSVGLVTDMPGLIVEIKDRNSFMTRLSLWIDKKYISLLTGFIFVAEAANKVLNLRNKPYMVMEGMVDNVIAEDESVNKENKQGDNFVILYAGGIFEQYGSKLLVDAVKRIPDPKLRLVFYGNGPYVEELKNEAQADSRIEYRGLASNQVIVEEEKKASLLINPRPTNQDFTMYSFPSKNLEYMLSGTPVLTTDLPGMPKEYHEYVYIFEDESVDGFARTIKRLMNLPSDELTQKGKKARTFICSNKNKCRQAERIVSFLIKILDREIDNGK